MNTNPPPWAVTRPEDALLPWPAKRVLLAVLWLEVPGDCLAKKIHGIFDSTDDAKEYANKGGISLARGAHAVEWRKVRDIGDEWTGNDGTNYWHIRMTGYYTRIDAKADAA